MWTIKYKDGYIHGYISKENCRVQYKNYSYEVKSLLAAKQLVTKLMKEF